MPLYDLHLQGFGKRNHRTTRNAVKETVGNRRMNGAFLIHEKHIRACRFGEIAAIVQHQRILKTLFFRSMLGQGTDHVEAGRLGMYWRGFR